LSLSFFDIQIGYNNQLFDIESGNDVVQFGYSDSLYVIPLFIILIIYSIYFICKQTKKPICLSDINRDASNNFRTTDIISGGQRSTMGYLIPCYLGIAVAYLLTTQITSISIKSCSKILAATHAHVIFCWNFILCC